MEIKPKIKIASVCFHGRADPQRNWQHLRALLDRKLEIDIDWLLLPEVFLGIGKEIGKDVDPRAVARFYEETALPGLQQLAKDRSMVIFAGTRPRFTKAGDSGSEAEADKAFNTMDVIGRSGDLLTSYDKIHLFRLDSAQPVSAQDPALQAAKPVYDETAAYRAGSQAVAIEIDGFKVGLTICFDLRFPTLFQTLNEPKRCDLFLVPAAFTRETGRAHWEILLRARAIENQAYVVSSAQTGEHGGGKVSHGHSLLIDPWGQVLADSGEEEGIVSGELSRERIVEVRRRLPLLRSPAVRSP